MKKIEIYNTNLGFGGIERYITTLANLLSEKYHVELIVIYKTTENPAFQLNDKVSIKYLINDNPYSLSLKKMIKSKKILAVVKEINRRIKLFFLQLKLVKKQIKNSNADVLIGNRKELNKKIGKFSKNPNTIKIAVEHNYHQNNRRFIKELIESIKGFNYFVISTKELYDDYKNIMPEKVEIILIPHSIDFKSNIKSKIDKKNLVSVGRFSPEKGFDDLIKVIKKYKTTFGDIKLFLIGDGPEKEKIETLVKEYKLENNVILTGFLDQSQIEKYFLKSSLYVMTSHTEAFGLVLIEAMNYGIPCIAFDSASGARELVNKQVGVLIKDRNYDEMANSIHSLLTNKNLLINYQKQINKYIQNFYPEKHLKMWLKILKDKGEK